MKESAGYEILGGENGGLKRIDRPFDLSTQQKKKKKKTTPRKKNSGAKGGEIFGTKP